MSERKKMSLPVVDLARENGAFRKALWTGAKTQLVLMTIPAGADE